MRRSLITIAMFATVSVFAQSQQCEGTTKANTRCKQTVKNGKLCHHHNPDYVKKIIAESVVCSATTRLNTPCRMKTRHESGICHHHRPKTD